METAYGKQTAEETEEKNLVAFCKEPCSCEEISILDTMLIFSFIKKAQTVQNDSDAVRFLTRRYGVISKMLKKYAKTIGICGAFEGKKGRKRFDRSMVAVVDFGV